MWTVGDRPETLTAFLGALAGSHGMSVVVKVYLGGVELGTVPIETGMVMVSARDRIRRRAELEVPERYWPTEPDDLLSPYGVELRAWWTVTAGAYTYPPVPVFTGRVESVTRNRYSGRLHVQCLDRFAQVNDQGFEELTPAPTGLVTSAIRTLLLEVYPDATVTITATSTATIPRGLLWRDGDGSRGQAIDDLAYAVGAEVLALPDGNFLLRDIPTLGASPAWTVRTGDGGVIVRDVTAVARTGIANRWVLVGEQTTGATPVRAVVTETTGPLAYGGPYGKVVRRVSSPLLGGTAQAYAAGLALRDRVRGLARSREVTVVANPALEAGDVLQVEVPAAASYEWHIVDEFALPLAPEPATTTVATRSTTEP